MFFCSLAVSLHSEQWYQVSETELKKLEAISQSSETDRQNWLSQAGELKDKVQSLLQGSKTLNSQLAAEREATKNLRISFEQSAGEQLLRASSYETEITVLKDAKAKIENDVLKVKNQRNVLFFILITLFGGISVAMYLKIRR